MIILPLSATNIEARTVRNASFTISAAVQAFRNHEEPGPRRSTAIPSVWGSVQGAETRGFSGNSDYTQRSSEDWAEKSHSTDSDTVSACSDRDESFGDYDELSDRSSGSEDNNSLSGQEDDYNDQSEDEDGDDDGSDDY